MLVRRNIIIPDVHHPFHDDAAVKCVYEACKIVKPHRFVFLGDVAECEGVSDYQWKGKRKPEFEWLKPTIDREVASFNRFLDFHDTQMLKNDTMTVYLQGNHEERYDRLVERDTVLVDTLNREGRIGYGWQNLMGASERGYKYLPYGDMYKIGKLYCYHGNFFGGMHHAKSHLLKMGVNVIYGHWHDVQQYSIQHKDGERSAWSIGCLKSLDKNDNRWLQGRPINWAHAFAIVDEHPDGNFGVTVVWIINGCCVVDGKFIDGKKSRLKIPE